MGAGAHAGAAHRWRHRHHAAQPGVRRQQLVVAHRPWVNSRRSLHRHKMALATLIVARYH